MQVPVLKKVYILLGGHSMVGADRCYEEKQTGMHGSVFCSYRQPNKPVAASLRKRDL